MKSQTLEIETVIFIPTGKFVTSFQFGVLSVAGFEHWL